MKSEFRPASLLPALVLIGALFGCATDPPRGADPPGIGPDEEPSVSIVTRSVATDEVSAAVDDILDAQGAAESADKETHAGSAEKIAHAESAENAGEDSHAESAGSDGGASSPSEPPPAPVEEAPREEIAETAAAVEPSAPEATDDLVQPAE